MSGFTFWAVLAALAVAETYLVLILVGICRMAARGDYAASERRTEEVS